MQNGLERLLAGISESLSQVVAPAVDDPYARAQAMSAAELIENLAARITWRRDYLFAWVPACREVADRAYAEGNLAPSDTYARMLALGDPSTVGEEPGDAEAYVAAHLEVLTELIRWAPSADETLREAIQAVVDQQFSGEVSRLRRAPQMKD